MIEHHDISANGLTFSTRAAGPSNGRPVMLLHGFPQTSWCWSAQLEALGDAGYRAVAPDQRGYSLMARPTDVGAYRSEHLVADVVAMADALEWATFDLVGHDWGAMVGWLTTARHANRIRSFTSVSTPHPLALRLSQFAQDAEETEPHSGTEGFLVFGVAEAKLLGPDGTALGLRKLLSATGLRPEAVEVYVEAMRAHGAMTAALNWYRAMSGDEVAKLPPITTPTLYVWSTGDAALGRTAAEATAVYVSGSYTYVELEGVSHWIPETLPDRLSDPLSAHLAKH